MLINKALLVLFWGFVSIRITMRFLRYFGIWFDIGIN